MPHATPEEGGPDAMVPPERVGRTLDFFGRHGLWHVVSRNSQATSCRDAAARRQRLGREGIPIYDELRSFCGAAYYPDGGRRLVLLHCRANSYFDMDAATVLLGARKRLARLPPEELSHHQAGYGTVNPFSEAGEYLQVFDEDVLARYMPPHTMMTNAGAPTWAVEFRPAELVEALRHEAPAVLVGRIAMPVHAMPRLPSFGIITGNGPESGMALWRYLNEEVHTGLSAQGHMRGDLSYPKVVVHSLPEMGLSMELVQRQDDVWAVIQTAVQQLCAAGVTHIALACNTTQYFAERIREICAPDVTFVSMVDVTLDHIRREGLSDITILGIPLVASLGEYSAYRPLAAVGVQPVREFTRSHLEELAYLVKQLDATSPDARSLNRLQHVIRKGVPTSRVLTALTEISVLLERFPRLRDSIGGKEVIDPLRLCASAMAQTYLNALPREEVEEPAGETADGEEHQARSAARD